MLYARFKTTDNCELIWQNLKDHLENVAETARKNASVFDSEEIAYVSGLFHDLGKTATEFQKYLKDSASADPEQNNCLHCSINHSEAGAAYVVEQLDKFWGTTLAYLIAGHHAGLPDFSNCNGSRAALDYRLNTGRQNLEAIRGKCETFFKENYPRFESLNRSKPPRTIRSNKDYHLWVRFLFSALVDADRLDAEAFGSHDVLKTRGAFASLPELKAKFDRYMETSFAVDSSVNLNSSEKSLQELRNSVLAACRKAGQTRSETSRFALTVPTGGGKTLSSMAFALERALANNLDRIIYVIPYTSIIEQTANVFRKIFGYENVVEHHSKFDLEKIEPTKDNATNDLIRQKLALAAENWDAPIILTTNVQFFESLYSADPNRCRKVWRIARSVVILDEAQMIKPQLLSPCVDVLNRLSDSYQTTVVFSTATPSTEALTRLDQLTKSCSGTPQNLKDFTLIVDSSALSFDELTRVRYDFRDCKEALNWEQIADRLEEYDEVLCVVNRRKDCYDLYKKLRDRELKRKENAKNETTDDGMPETVHLSALMCGEHRSQTIDSIHKRLEENRVLKNKRPLRVISTQLIEAGVDLDFPVAFRALAGLDSIVQTGGRCNREGTLGSRGGLVRVFNPKESDAPAGLLRKGKDSTEELMRNPDFDITSSGIFKRYFECFYNKLTSLDEIEVQHQKVAVLKELSLNVTNGSFRVPFRTIGENFKMIENNSLSILVQFGEGKTLIDRLRHEKPTRELLRRLQRFSVEISLDYLNKLLETGKIEEIFPGILVQSCPSLYNERVGLDLFGEGLAHSDFFV